MRAVSFTRSAVSVAVAAAATSLLLLSSSAVAEVQLTAPPAYGYDAGKNNQGNCGGFTSGAATHVGSKFDVKFSITGKTTPKGVVYVYYSGTSGKSASAIAPIAIANVTVSEGEAEYKLLANADLAKVAKGDAGVITVQYKPFLDVNGNKTDVFYQCADIVFDSAQNAAGKKEAAGTMASIASAVGIAVLSLIPVMV